MPDTGAPWNIPYVASTDLVSDWPADSLALANAIDAGLDAAGPAGIGSNVVQTVKTNTYTAAVGTTYTDIPDVSVSITPSSATSKILVISYIVCASSSSNAAGLSLRLVRDSTDIFLGTAASNRRQATYGPSGPASSSNRGVVPVSFSFVDSPATASQVTYKVQIATNSGGTVYVNRSEGDVDLAGFDRPPSALMAIEVAA